MVAADWTFALSYGATGSTGDPTVSMFWRDFGFAVVLIGIGYFIVALDPIAHRGIVVLGIGAKLFDVVVLAWRSYTGAQVSDGSRSSRAR
jgi:Na+-driven multidrug efflux pump